MNLYSCFHLNLAFSSIEEDQRIEVIKKCYWPLLNLADQQNTKFGIELSGWTLETIKKLDSEWVQKLRKLINLKKIEIVGSGYCQIIGPLVPYELNIINHSLGLDIYKKELGIRPSIVMVNEMAYSSGLVDVFLEMGYRGFIMDRENIEASLRIQEIKNRMPAYAKGLRGNKLPILWSFSTMFQKLQGFIFGDITEEDYSNFLISKLSSDLPVVSFYTNDVEIFDFRPGRFSEERPIHKEGEWKRLEYITKKITEDHNVKWHLPSEAIKLLEPQNISSGSLISLRFPAPVKKQIKYNLVRWAVTGRNDTWLNTFCYKLLEVVKSSKKHNESLERILCELWSSDLRTHITDERWKAKKAEIKKITDKYNISFHSSTKELQKLDQFDKEIPNESLFNIEHDEEGVYLNINTENIKLTLNKRRGMAIDKLIFRSHGQEPCIGTLQHGYFNDIELGADFYSGSIFIESPSGERITGLTAVEPLFSKEGDFLVIKSLTKTNFGSIIKTYRVDLKGENFYIDYHFPDWQRKKFLMRLGFVTFLEPFNNKNLSLAYCSGTKDEEILYLEDDVDHTKPVSNRVSSMTGLPVTEGYIRVANNNDQVINLSWNQAECSPLPMIVNKKDSSGRVFSRIVFSLQEVDDTLKEGGNILPFSLKINS